MAEPQPSNITEGAEQPEAPAANAEDRKAAAAMSAMDVKESDEAPKKEVDMKALSDAMKHLDVEKAGTTAVAAKKKKDDEVKKPLVKVDPADVALLVDQLDMNKTKATEFLRAHDADVVKAMTAWVTASV
nr:hypothetical protein CFP56_09133 [Quercus suber]POE87009.1 hypothetical protein CFP56_64039 [Quercus suber]